MAKKKISRKELLDQTDEFITLTQKVINFVQKHPNKFLAGLAAIVALVIIVFGIKFYFDRQARLALAAYNQALFQVSKLRNLDSKGSGEEIEEALDALERVSSKYARTAPGRQVLIDLGTLYFHLKRYNQAEYTYKKCLETLTPEEEALLAYTYEAQGKINEAAAYWEQIVQLPGQLLKEEAFFNLGRVYEELGQPEKAEKAYQQLLEKFPNSPNSHLAKFKLKQSAQGKSD
ncbi:MAG: tetratricopeptide repeat protein [Deltaproteobacteria bacterium]|nr:tetratricopeptide repeat protein [Deltaproteobacteria bacterium]